MSIPENSAIPIVIYQSTDGSIMTEVKLQDETVWLTQAQMADLFQTTKQNVGQHIRNVFMEGELAPDSVVKDFFTTAGDAKQYRTKHYNLDVIISVGYRVRSQQGTRFRIWASRILKDYLVQGYALNTQRLQTQQEHIKQLERTLTLFQQNLIEQASLPEAHGLVNVIAGYTRTFVLLNQFDSERLPLGDFATTIRYEIQPVEAVAGIAALKADLMAQSEASELFGNQKDDSFAGILGNIVQSFGGEFLYPSIEDAGRASVVFRHQESSIFRRQQTHRRFSVHLVPAAQPVPFEN